MIIHFLYKQRRTTREHDNGKGENFIIDLIKGVKHDTSNKQSSVMEGRSMSGKMKISVIFMWYKFILNIPFIILAFSNSHPSQRHISSAAGPKVSQSINKTLNTLRDLPLLFNLSFQYFSFCLLKLYPSAHPFSFIYFLFQVFI